MPAIKFDTTLQRLIKDMHEVRSALRHLNTNLPLYDVSNENTPDPISTDQDDYVPGNYDILRVNATADFTFTGFRNGKKGRFLEILNVGTGTIRYTDEDANSSAENRIATPYNEPIDQLPNARVRFYYDSTQERWTLSDAPNIQGIFGKSAIITHSTTTIITPNTNTETLLTPDTIVSDEWGYWDNTNSRFVVPAGENGIYLVGASFSWATTLGGGTLRQVRIMRNGTGNRGSIGVPNISNIATNMFVCSPVRLLETEYVEFQVRQDSGGALNCNLHGALNPAIFFIKLQ